MNFIEKLIEKIEDKNSVVCMGLDPRMDNEGAIPEFLIAEYEEPNDIILEFNKVLIEEVHELIPIIKPQIAFYEKYDALNALKETINFAHEKGLLVILDSKRNDIGSTSKAYAESTFEIYQADACTLLKAYSNKGLFILVKTSNPSSKDFQDLFSIKLMDVKDEVFQIHKKEVLLERNYIQMAKLVKKWGVTLPTFKGFNNLGVVVGATFPAQLKEIRKIVKNSFILIPGYGTQGGSAKQVIHGFYPNGLGGIVNSSRGIIYAYNKYKNFKPEEFAKAARYEIEKMNQEINSEIKKL
ncbi:MAG: orotidine-5'-phosphate decarboxylase [Promethearchaeota archaeon]